MTVSGSSVAYFDKEHDVCDLICSRHVSSSVQV
jgi:hypothetical protein